MTDTHTRSTPAPSGPNADYRTPSADFFEEAETPQRLPKIEELVARMIEDEAEAVLEVEQEAEAALEVTEEAEAALEVTEEAEEVLEAEDEIAPAIDEEVAPAVEEAIVEDPPAVEEVPVDEVPVDEVQAPAAVVEQVAPAPEPQAAPLPRAWEPMPELSQPKRRLGLWLGIPAAAVGAIAAVVASTIFIAPGVVVAGVDVGWRTTDAASEMVKAALADTVVTLETPTKSITLTGEELGLSVDATSLISLAYGDHPLWNVGSWNPGNVPIDVDVDSDAVLAALSAAAPSVFQAPTDAEVVFSRKLDAFTTTDSAAGNGIDFDGLASAVSDALSSGSRVAALDATPVRLEPAISNAEAEAQLDAVNELVGSAGFYIDGARVVTIDPADAASWITFTPQDGDLAVDVDTDAAMADIWKVVAALPRTVNRPPTNELIVTNSAGAHLRTIQGGAPGWTIGATSGIAAAYVEAFAAGDSAYELEGQPIDFVTNLLFRSIEVNKTTGETILYENGEVVDVYPIAIGQSATPTPEGHFTVFWQLPVQDMGCVPGYDYCTRGVPWITYFAGDNGFHGTYWHDNFGAGAMMSHGCVNMTIAAAERVYYFAQEGTEVWVHT